MDHRMSMLGKNAIFTNIMDMDAGNTIDLYRRRNRVEHCFRATNTMDIAFPVYHWKLQDNGPHVPCTNTQRNIQQFWKYIAHIHHRLPGGHKHQLCNERKECCHKIGVQIRYCGGIHTVISNTAYV